MNISLSLLTLISFFAFSNTTWANQPSPDLPKSLCEAARAHDSNGNVVTLFQHVFDGDVYDLAMRISNGGIKRVTFGGSTSPTCHYQAMALASGGEWGWHLAWVSEDGLTLNYARMDGVAWVSSPTKKLSKHVKITTQPQFVTLGQKVWIVWGESTDSQRLVYTVYSDDEGRSWNPTRSFSQTGGAEGKLNVVIKEAQPYVQFGTHAELFPLRD